MKTLRGWGGLVRISRDPPQNPHYRDEVEGPSTYKTKYRVANWGGYHRPGRHRPSPTSAGTAIVLLGDQPPVPAENRVGRDDACHLTQDPPAEFLASHRESPALGVGQRSGRGPRCSRRTRFSSGDSRCDLLGCDSPSQPRPARGSAERGHGLRLHGSDTAVTHVVSGIHSPRPFSRTIRRCARRLNPKPIYGGTSRFP